jgi:hypothetical protein
LVVDQAADFPVGNGGAHGSDLIPVWTGFWHGVQCGKAAQTIAAGAGGLSAWDRPL